jgi:hypothetical protein
MPYRALRSRCRAAQAPPRRGDHGIDPHAEHHAGSRTADLDRADKRMAVTLFVLRDARALVDGPARVRTGRPPRVERPQPYRIAWVDGEHGREIAREMAMQSPVIRLRKRRLHRL